MVTKEDLLEYIIENCDSIEFNGTSWVNKRINFEQSGENKTNICSEEALK